MIRNLEAPPCHWTGCSWFKRPMKLMKESDDFWFFFCECGCTRAVSKPSTRDRSIFTKYQQDIETIKYRQKVLGSRREYSLPSKGIS